LRKHSGRGAKAPRQRRQRRRSTSRGTRGGRCNNVRVEGKRVSTQQVPSALNHQRRSTAVVPGRGSRTGHFRKGYEKSVEHGKVLAQQIMDIKYRAEQRRAIGRVPLPPRAAEGLRLRQQRLIQASRKWGDALSCAEARPGGRVSWRLEVFRRSYVRSAGGERSQETLFPGTDYTYQSEYVIEPEPPRPEHRAMWRFCPSCGSKHFADMRVCVNCVLKKQKGAKRGKARR